MNAAFFICDPEKPPQSFRCFHDAAGGGIPCLRENFTLAIPKRRGEGCSVHERKEKSKSFDLLFFWWLK